MNRRISAVTLNTFQDYVFTPAFIALIILILLIPFLCSNMSGDGTAEGKFKVFVTYSFLISSIIFTVTNISISCSLISSEWKKKTLLLLDVKPIKRWEIVFGKWLGMLTINIVLIICFLSAMTISSILISRNLKKNFPEYRNIFTTEAELFPISLDESSKTKPSGFTTFFQMSPKASEGEKETYAVLPKENMKWTFEGIHKSSGNVYLSYRFQTSGPEGQTALGYWLVGNSSMSTPLELETNLSQGKPHRFQVPNEAISNDGELDIVYLNIEPKNISVLFTKSDFKILYPQSNYWMNLLRGAGNLLILITFICSVGLCFSCIVSNLTAVLSTSILIFISYLHDFTQIMLNSILVEMQTQQPVEIIQRLSYPVLKFTAFILPPLDKALPHSYIGSFLLIPSSYLVYLFLRIIVLGALPMLIIAIIYLSHRELGIPNE